jgi:hypothetical protein
MHNNLFRNPCIGIHAKKSIHKRNITLNAHQPIHRTNIAFHAHQSILKYAHKYPCTTIFTKKRDHSKHTTSLKHMYTCTTIYAQKNKSAMDVLALISIGGEPMGLDI